MLLSRYLACGIVRSSNDMVRVCYRIIHRYGAVETSSHDAIAIQRKSIFLRIGYNGTISFPITKNMAKIRGGTNGGSRMLTVFGYRNHFGSAVLRVVDTNGQCRSAKEYASFHVDEPTPIPIQKELVESQAVDIDWNIRGNIIENASVLVIGTAWKMFAERWCWGIAVDGL